MEVIFLQKSYSYSYIILILIFRCSCERILFFTKSTLIIPLEIICLFLKKKNSAPAWFNGVAYNCCLNMIEETFLFAKREKYQLLWNFEVDYMITCRHPHFFSALLTTVMPGLFSFPFFFSCDLPSCFNHTHRWERRNLRTQALVCLRWLLWLRSQNT